MGAAWLLAMDESGRVRGLAFYVIEDDRIDLAGITSDDVSATDALLDGVIAAARETGAQWIRTLTQAMTLIVAAENKSARALYDAAGFRPDAIFLAATLQLSASARATSMARDRELQPTPSHQGDVLPRAQRCRPSELPEFKTEKRNS